MQRWKRLLAVVLTLLSTAGCSLVYRMGGVSQARELHRIGESAQGLILEIIDTGMTINNDPVVWLVLKVYPTEGDPYQAETKAWISRVHVPQFQPGKFIPVRFDPANKSRVSIDVYDY